MHILLWRHRAIFSTNGLVTLTVPTYRPAKGPIIRDQHSQLDMNGNYPPKPVPKWWVGV